MNSSDTLTATANINVIPSLQYVNSNGVNLGAAISLSGSSTSSIGSYTLNITPPHPGRFYIFYAISSNGYIINASPIFFTQYESATSLTLNSSSAFVEKGSAVTLNLASNKLLPTGSVQLSNGSGSVLSSFDFTKDITFSYIDTPTASTTYTLEFKPSADDYSQAPYSISLPITVTNPAPVNPFSTLSGNNAPGSVSYNPFATGSIRNIAYQEILNRYNSSSNNNNNFNFAKDVNISSEIGNAIITQSNVAMRFWGSLISSKPSIAVYLPTQSSAELSCRVRGYLSNPGGDLTSCYSLPISTNLPLIGNLDQGQGQSVAGGTYGALSQIQLTSATVVNPQIKFIGPLEIFNQLLINLNTSSTPTLFGDGAAKYYAVTLANLTYSGLVESEFLPGQSGYNSSSEIDLNRSLLQSGVSCANPCSGSNYTTYSTLYNTYLSQQYWSGGLASELLLAQYGFAKSQSFMSNRNFSAGNIEGFKSFFASNFGVSWDDWVKGGNKYLQDKFEGRSNSLAYYNNLSTPVAVVTPTPTPTPTPAPAPAPTPTPAPAPNPTPAPAPAPAPVVSVPSGSGSSNTVSSFSVSFAKSAHSSEVNAYLNQSSLSADRLPKLVDDGYFHFMGWALPGSGTIISSEIVLREDLILTPIWEDRTPKGYTLTFDTLGFGSVKAITGIFALEPTKLPVLADSERFKFMGWSVDGKLIIEGFTITKDATLTALWKSVENPTPQESKEKIVEQVIGSSQATVAKKIVTVKVKASSQSVKVASGASVALNFPSSIAKPTLLVKDLARQGITITKSNNSLTFPRAGRYEVIWQSKKVYYKISVVVAK